jgi:broad specificity phosphatase PhoE
MTAPADQLDPASAEGRQVAADLAAVLRDARLRIAREQRAQETPARTGT